MTRRLTALAFVGLLAADRVVSGNGSATPGSVDFARDVEPLLTTSCFPCHGAAAAQGDLRLDVREAALKGGASGPALVPGHAADSLLVKRVSGQAGTRMPIGLAPLSEGQIATLRSWIDQGASWGAAAPKGAVGAIDFTAQIQPIFKANCIRCHGPDQQKSQLRLDSRTNALKGGLSGRVILPGKAKDSLLIRRLLGQEKPRMPFEGTPLPDAQIALLRAWIDAGAPGPNDAAADLKVARHWAYVKPERPPLPEVRNGAWVRNPIDAFILARLEKEGLTPSPEAPRETLLRRLSLDLVGLPPTVAEIDAFVADTSPDAYEKAVDRLLASPHYGERWARPWLDLARYADSNGYEKDRLRVAWKYRDWVIDALNKDMSFRDFTIQQIAGDMLQGRDRRPEDRHGLPPEHAPQPGRRHRRRGGALGDPGGSSQHDVVGLARQHHGLRPVPQPQVRPLLPEGLLPDARLLRQHRLPGPRPGGDGHGQVDRGAGAGAADRGAGRAADDPPGRDRGADGNGREDGPDAPPSERGSWRSPIPPPHGRRWSRSASPPRRGARSRRTADRSVTVRGDTPDKDTYTVVVRAPVAGITAFRLEAMDARGSPRRRARDGRPPGTFVLTRFGVGPGAKGETGGARPRAGRLLTGRTSDRPGPRRVARDGLGDRRRDGTHARRGLPARTPLSTGSAAHVDPRPLLGLRAAHPRPLPSLGHDLSKSLGRPPGAGADPRDPRTPRATRTVERDEGS